MEQAPTEVPGTSRYYRQLDSLRFFSVAAVMLGHWAAWETPRPYLNIPHWGNGVIFFFVLSGFLITEILLQQKENIESGKRSLALSLKTFYIRRTLRIFPAYYLLIIFLLIINFKNVREIFPWLATYTINILEARNNQFIGNNLDHFWSLAVEEQFYIAWPLLLFLVPAKHIVKCIVATFLFSIGSRLCYTLLMPERWVAAMYLTHNVMFALSAGAFLAYIKYKKQPLFDMLGRSVIATPLAFALYVLSFACLVYPGHLPAFAFLFDELVFTLLSVVIIARCVGSEYRFFGKWLLENKTFTHLGQISYGLYLFHLFASPLFYEVISQMLSLHTEKKVTAWIIFFLITWGIAELSFRYVEKPINRLKKYFPY